MFFTTSHTFQVEVHHARTVNEIFDAISYEKGSAVIRMLQGYFGDDIIQVRKFTWYVSHLVFYRESYHPKKGRVMSLAFFDHFHKCDEAICNLFCTPSSFLPEILLSHIH